MEPEEAAAAVLARRIVLGGRVQGLGIRPAVARWAGQCGLAGVVRNTLDGVEIVVEGPVGRVGRFEQQLLARLPAAARVEAVHGQGVPLAGWSRFDIERTETTGPVGVQVPSDLAACEDCLAEVARTDDRRYGYPFTSCTLCGPRYSIIDTMPYERAGTSMAAFALCARCRQEYASPTDRRFHAQTNACPQCGPQLWSTDGAGRVLGRRDDALRQAAAAILQGRIVALRGVGGYQLAVDGTRQAAVERLRQRKGRPAKPLAVMVESPDQAQRLAQLDPRELQSLCDPANPIVVLRARPGSPLAPAVHPHLDSVGILLPTTPLHRQLLAACRQPLVMTSGNRDGEPLACAVQQSLDKLGDIADLWLHHDRPIRRPVDDSVVRVMAGRQVTLRLARGLAPLPLNLPAPLPAPLPALALGGHQKAAVAVSNGLQAVLGPHIGDLDGLGARERYVHQAEQLVELLAAKPECVAHDLHPDYFTTSHAAQWPAAALAVQHHHAHIVAGMLEHGWLDRTVLGVAFDGTGFGPDGTVWGGEFLVTSATAFRRVAHLRTFRLPGGEAAVRQPWRVAVAMVHQAAGPSAARQLTFDGVPHDRPQDLLPILDKDAYSPRTSSAGRLFDAVAALVLRCGRAAFEGHPAMLLEAACDPHEPGSYDLPLRKGPAWELDWRLLICQILADRAAGASPAAMAMRFHRALAAGVAAVCQRFSPLPVVLAGGVFQNRLLVELVAEQLAGSEQPFGPPGRIPPNDGGLAAGQLAVLLHTKESRQCV